MVPAMDRVSPTSRRRNWIVLGLGLLIGTSASGCAEIKSQIFGDSKIGELGHVEEASDVYARTTPRTLLPPPGQKPGLGDPDSPLFTQVEEVGPAMMPTSVPPAVVANADGIALQNPRPLEGGSGVKLTSSNSGVPNAAKILAASSRKPAIKPDTIVAQARAALEGMPTYEVTLHRQERVNGTLLDEEDVVVAIRRLPRAVRLNWPNGPNQGREVLYRADEPGGQMHIKMANPAMPRLSLNPENPMVMRNSRHPVTEAGFDSLVEGLESGVTSSALTYAGIETPTGIDRPAHCLTRTTPSGENWKVYLDVENHLPVLIQALDGRGDLLERYVYRDIKVNPADLASADAFDPTARWGAPKGLLGRLARGGADQESATNDATPR